jgi:hypothetical protein
MPHTTLPSRGKGAARAGHPATTVGQPDSDSEASSASGRASCARRASWQRPGPESQAPKGRAAARGPSPPGACPGGPEVPQALAGNRHRHCQGASGPC